MPSNIKISFISKGFHDILSSQNVASVVDQQAQRIAAKAGDGFEASHFMGNFGGGRVIGVVRAETYEARRAEATDKTLSRAVGGG